MKVKWRLKHIHENMFSSYTSLQSDNGTHSKKPLTEIKEKRERQMCWGITFFLNKGNLVVCVFGTGMCSRYLYT